MHSRAGRRQTRIVVGAVVALATLTPTLAPALAAPAPVVAPTTAPGASQNAAFGLQAATAGKLDARPDLSYSATPGARVKDEVAVVNLGRVPLTLRIYATDATTDGDGGFALLPAAQTPTGVGRWVSVNGSTTVRVPARTAAGPSHVIVPFTLTVPASATPGDHAGGVVASLTSSARDSKGLRVRLDQRVAMRVYARVSGALRPHLAVEKLALDWSGPALNGNPFGDGTLTVSYRVHNTGNVVLGGTQRIAVDSWLAGSTDVPALAAVPELLPGASLTVRQRVTGVFPGVRTTATVTVTPSAVAGSNVRPEAVSVSASVWTIPWLLIVLILLLLGIAGLLVYRRLHREPVSPDRPTTHRARSSRTAGATR